MTRTLEVEHICTAYDRADVLTDVSITAREGEITCILGSNGAGKTTLIRSILALTRPHCGTIRLGSVDLTRLATHHIAAAGIVCIPEGRKVFPKLSVAENLRLGAYRERNPNTIRSRFDYACSIFPRLAERLNQLAGTMSGGEQAMLSIARGLMANPAILLIDEPSLGLSPLYVQQNFGVIRRINEQGTTVLLVEQNVRQTLGVAHRGYVLSQGRVVAHGTAAELRENDEVRQAYFG